MKIIGHHRSRKLAERHARDSGMVIVDRRNRKGHKSKRGRTFIFSDKLMWRYTVAAAAPIKRKYHHVRATTWAVTKASLKVKEARTALMAALPGKTYPFSERWFPVNEEYEQVEYQQNLIGKVDIGT